MSVQITIANVNVITRSAARVAVKKLLQRVDVTSAKVIDNGVESDQRWVVQFEYIETVIEQLQAIEHKTTVIDGTCEIIGESKTVENIGLPVLTMERKTLTIPLSSGNRGNRGNVKTCIMSDRHGRKKSVIVKIKRSKLNQ
jgi:hypothetical protein